MFHLIIGGFILVPELAGEMKPELVRYQLNREGYIRQNPLEYEYSKKPRFLNNIHGTEFHRIMRRGLNYEHLIHNDDMYGNSTFSKDSLNDESSKGTSVSKNSKVEATSMSPFDITIWVALLILSIVLVVSMYIQCRAHNLQDEAIEQRLTEARDGIILNQQRINQLSIFDYNKNDVRVKNQDICPICLEPFSDGSVTNILPCGHLFDTGCIQRWLILQSPCCPMCKYDVRNVFLDPSIYPKQADTIPRSLCGYLCCCSCLRTDRKNIPLNVPSAEDPMALSNQQEILINIDFETQESAPISTPIRTITQNHEIGCSRPSSQENFHVVPL